MLKSRHLLLVFATLISGIEAATAADDLGKQIAHQGNNKGATACIACHGTKGEGQEQAGYPKLAGLNQAYMEKQLHDFASNSRINSTMEPIAKALSQDEVHAVSAYFSKLPVPSPQKTEANNEMMQDGKDLAMNGNWPNDVPSCFACHGVNAQGIADTFPTLAGQHASYIENQLKAWKSGQRHNDPNGLMQGIAKRLSHTQVKAVSTYLATLPATDQ